MNSYMWVYEIKPELYDIKYGKRRYIIYSEKYGYYTKKEAEIICDFLRFNFLKIINSIQK